MFYVLFDVQKRRRRSRNIYHKDYLISYVFFSFFCSVLLSLQSKERYLSLSFSIFFLLYQFNKIFVDISTFFSSLCLIKLCVNCVRFHRMSLSLCILMLFEKGRWRLSCMRMRVFTPSLSLPLSPSLSSSFKYFGLRIRIVKGTVIRRWRLWSNFEVQERTRIFCKSS